jgi:hypothetical protein
VKPSDPGLFPFFIDLIDSPHSLNDQFANKFKQVLGCIISNTQKGFMKDRFMGENTRLLYDLMHL